MNRRDFIASAGAAGLLSAAFSPIEALAATSTPRLSAEEMAPRQVRIKRGFAPGEIHVDANNFSLYWTLEDRKAIRYRVGIGRPGLYEAGVFTIRRKAEWPSWTPTAEMIERSPRSYARFKDGMPGGPNNPLGARALYLYDANGRDTYLRIHGTNQPHTIGTAVSNGCARLINEHIIALYDMVPIGTRVVLYPLVTA